MTSFWNTSSLRALFSPFAAPICASAIVLGGLTACTVFDGLTVPLPGETGGGGGSSVPVGPGPSTSGSGSAASVGAGGTGGVLVPVEYMAEDRAARACSRAFTCPNLAASIARSTGVPVSATNFSLCMAWLTGPIAPDRRGFIEQQEILKCVADAGGCSEALACLPFAIIEADDSACSDNQSKCIDSETAADCVDLVIERCQTPGFDASSGCTEANDDAACVVGSCDPQGTTSCDGDTLESCRKAGLARLQCAVAGLACAEQGPSASCAGSGACSSPGASSCEGDAVHACAGEQLSPFRCDTMGMSCATGAEGAYCEPPSADCTPWSDTVNVCTGNKSISICVDGEESSINCPYGKCIGPANGKTAYCG